MGEISGKSKTRIITTDIILIMELDKIWNEDCIEGLKRIPDKSVDLVLTDIPYNEVNREDKGLRKLDKEGADIGNFDIRKLTETLANKTNGSVYMFCGINQISPIRETLSTMGLSTRLLIWEKTNPSPMNGETIWLSGIECCVFGKKSGATFNEHCKNTVFRYPCGESKIHPTQKPIDLFRRLLLASTNQGDVVLDPFMGSATTTIACVKENRHFIGFEMNAEYYKKGMERLKNELAQPSLF